MIRPYKLSDRQQLIDVFTLNVPAYFDPKEIGDYKGYLDEYSETYFTIEHQGSVVGGIGYYITEVNRSGSITWIFIDPEHAGHGLGKLAVEHCLAILREDEHVDKLVVQTSQLTDKFFAKFGFQLIRTEKDYWGEGFDLYLMELVC